MTFILLSAQQLSVHPNFISGVEDDEDEYSSEEDSISSGDISFSLSVFLNSRRLYNSSFSLSFIWSWFIFCFTLQSLAK
jgi:hypothetical protein